ncbi:hypothetical protein CROQUDRAFT_107584 [Cronartium quercuum f. sp. fusiforme G11]|uniref:Uncharacterized protein n=1 Tax=Cronartium quercuum f. sp. fusiforme G11 TaxID=708437 RepID=A0A9P6NLG4_9BASI|nr:hypothetical protein CROQUDRAFT_107584 [Cronartium quercuum f. sp. fusiforme G11]
MSGSSQEHTQSPSPSQPDLITKYLFIRHSITLRSSSSSKNLKSHHVLILKTPSPPPCQESSTLVLLASSADARLCPVGNRPPGWQNGIAPLLPLLSQILLAGVASLISGQQQYSSLANPPAITNSQDPNVITDNPIPNPSQHVPQIP